MKAYIIPEIKINKFQVESIVTDSSNSNIDFDSNGVATDNVREVSYGDMGKVTKFIF